MVRLLRHRQTKGAATDRLNLRPPRHISPLPIPYARADGHLTVGGALLSGNDPSETIGQITLTEENQRLLVVGNLHSNCHCG